MTWAAAKLDAERLVLEIEALIAARRAQHPGAALGCLRLALYPTPHDFRYLRPGDPWSHEHHTAVVRAVTRQLKRAGHRVALVDCTAAACAAWCEEQGLVAHTQHRAAYVAHLITPTD
jgi:hypothetical protein